MSAKRVGKIYWDTCIFIAFFKEEKRKTDRKNEIKILIEKAEKNELLITTSAITLTEAYHLGKIEIKKELEKIRLFLQHNYMRIINS